jgi:microcystin-dependent protein
MFNQKPKNTIIISFIVGTLIAAASLYVVTTVPSQEFTVENNVKDLSNMVVVYAQMNNAKGSNTTMIGDVMIPSASNDTKTSVVDNATNSTISTTIDKTQIAQNITSAANFAKEPPTTPISPTGISTQGLHQPPGHRLVNNSVTTFGQ